MVIEFTEMKKYVWGSKESYIFFMEERRGSKMIKRSYFAPRCLTEVGPSSGFPSNF